MEGHQQGGSDREEDAGERGREGGLALGPTRQPDGGAGRPGHDRLKGLDATQVFCQGVGAHVAPLGVQVHGHRDHRGDAAAEGAVHAVSGGRRVPEDRSLDLVGAGSLEGAGAGQDLVERDAEAIDVRSRVHRPAALLDLLGSHVLRRPEPLAGAGQGLVLGAGGEAEVEHHGLAVRADHEVARLHVPVDDSQLVGGVQRQRDAFKEAQHPVNLGPGLGGDREDRGVLHARGADLGGQVRPRDEAHGDEGLLAVEVGIEDLGDGVVVDAREDLGLALEPSATGLGDESTLQELQRDAATQAVVHGFVDHPLPTLTQRAHDPKSTDSLAVDLARGALGLVVGGRSPAQVLRGDLGLRLRVALEVEAERAVRTRNHVVLEVLDEVQNGGIDGFFVFFQGRLALDPP